MKILVVHVDGLLVETSDHILNEEPHIHGVDLVKRLLTAHLGSTLFIADEGSPDVVRQWLARLDIRPTWVDVYEATNGTERVENILARIGGLQGSLDLYITASSFDAAVMAAEGVSAVHFLHPARVKDWGPALGSTWERRLKEIDQPPEDTDEDLV